MRRYHLVLAVLTSLALYVAASVTRITHYAGCGSEGGGSCDTPRAVAAVEMAAAVIFVGAIVAYLVTRSRRP
ncbi:hypothetical protein DSM112329_02885 [Paraconexibacter sp. AEG42_29]|uniref:Uncharacterized protein n=1 Tax=Paraconexibacter sp. AEG42_29 TaxID=2997339 RepID=A0AAU7AWK5_9ACTN